MLNYPKQKRAIVPTRKRARKLRRRWFTDHEAVIEGETAIEWRDNKQLGEYWIRTFSFVRGSQSFWGTYIISFLPVPKPFRLKGEEDQLAMLGRCECYLIREADFAIDPADEWPEKG